MRVVRLLVLALLVLAIDAATAAAWTPEPARYGVGSEHNAPAG
jgi:hypothetical protein